ncbi:phosphopyruvate hydratase [Pajaroellobacter abortibovis]|uniref:Enolase n=1 Tax=Pajaroellobacter abortibovis TaxID=1882918 RepID=A0A1L6MWE2_9BACT|nr:phosphopyruvate hydratase [Pajaroellobacter abortibovis]APR99794.1 phosphopyruvate hydratase [Pajaroellobacter abortibovis]
MSEIRRVHAREILDSRGNPTVEVEIYTQSGVGYAAVPSGCSTGSYEAVELRDREENRFAGNGVRQAVRHVRETLGPALVGVSAFEQTQIDQLLLQQDHTPDKSRLGANAILGVSLAVARAAADTLRVPLWRYVGGVSARTLPVPMMNILNGGKHADNGLDFQELMIVPFGFDHFHLALQAGVEIFHQLRFLLQQKGLVVAVGDEGGFAPRLSSHEEAFGYILRAIEGAGYRPGEQIGLAIDCAATEFFSPEKGTYRFERKERSGSELIAAYRAIADRFPLISLEDGCAEDDWQGWKELTQTLGGRMQLVGDDLFVTHLSRLEQGVQQGCANAILIKPNQVGTLTEALEAIQYAKRTGYGVVISHRSGETEDTFIADLAVGTQAGQIKAGSLCRSERTSKYNQLLRVEEALGVGAVYAGKFFSP